MPEFDLLCEEDIKTLLKRGISSPYDLRLAGRGKSELRVARLFAKGFADFDRVMSDFCRFAVKSDHTRG